MACSKVAINNGEFPYTIHRLELASDPEESGSEPEDFEPIVIDEDPKVLPEGSSGSRTNPIVIDEDPACSYVKPYQLRRSKRLAARTAQAPF